MQLSADQQLRLGVLASLPWLAMVPVVATDPTLADEAGIACRLGYCR